jgi:hypothetical protein
VKHDERVDVAAGEGSGRDLVVTSSSVTLPADLCLPQEMFRATGLCLPPGVTYEQWVAVGRLLAHVQVAVAWWWGDWLNEGERRWGELYAQAIAETGRDYDTVRRWRYVAQRIEFGRRRPHLSWAHHQQVAALSDDEQDLWLDRAERGDDDQRWSRARLREEIAKAHGRRSWDLTEALVRLDEAVDSVLRRAPAGDIARTALGKRLIALGNKVLAEVYPASAAGAAEEQGR